MQALKLLGWAKAQQNRTIPALKGQGFTGCLGNALDFKGEVEGALGHPWDCDGWLTGYFFRHTARFLRIIKNQLLAF